MDANTLLLLLSLLVTGMVAGILAGLLGVGGGIVIVPVLFLILSGMDFPTSLTMHMAVGTSLLTIIPTSIVSMRSHHRRGAVDWGIFQHWLPAIMLAALLGGILSRYVDGSVLKGLFAVIALLAAYNLLYAGSTVRFQQLPGLWLQRGIAFVIGFFSAWLGIGGGTFTVPTLTLCNVPVLKAVGTSSAMGLLIAVPGTLGFMYAGWGIADRPQLSIGYVNLVAAVIIFSMSTLFAPLGSRLAHRIDAKLLKQVFAVFLILTASRMLWQLLSA